MTIDEFWCVIDAANDAVRGDCVRRRLWLREYLGNLPISEVQDFYQISTRLYQQAYDRRLWAAARLILQGGGDDGFMDFREGLILLGRRRYEEGLLNPDLLHDISNLELSSLINEGNLGFMDELLEPGDVPPVPDHPLEPFGHRMSNDEALLSFPLLAARFAR